MNLQLMILRIISKNKKLTQRTIAELLNFSVGTINKEMQKIRKLGFIEENSKEYKITKKGYAYLEPYKVNNAIILAAGFGSRFVPITYTTPKGLVKVKGKPMIERQIEQLLEQGITDITLVVGYLKEKFEYLIDKYDVKLVYNAEYKTKNNLASLYCVKDLLKNTYILSADNWMSENIFSIYEPCSWYSTIYQEGVTNEWCIKFNSKNKIIKITIGGENSWVMCGPVFFTVEFSEIFSKILNDYYHKHGTEDFLWEHILLNHLEELEMIVLPQKTGIVYEFETLEELRKFDKSYDEKSNEIALHTISEVFGAPENNITNIISTKSGMTNRSFIFTIEKKQYVFRMPGKGTEKLINRKQEKAVYDATNNLNFREKLIYFDENTGIKISKYYQNSRNSSADNEADIENSMKLARELHYSGAFVEHSFDIEKEIAKYKQYCKESHAILYRDYDDVEIKMQEIIDLKNTINYTPVLAHVDYVPDNILVDENSNYIMIDWEYSGMCDPIIDVAMYAIYAYYDKSQAEHLLSIYLQREPNKEECLRLYVYMALSGFLWMLWAAYKQSLEIDFGEYGMKMYRYAKDFYNYIKNLDD